ncbi:Unknown protein sequence [Pseudomonas syringae pv. maculicola]|nr:Unknown protein sequence [Pseudomonas syringae pv. maculicola]
MLLPASTTTCHVSGRTSALTVASGTFKTNNATQTALKTLSLNNKNMDITPCEV